MATRAQTVEVVTTNPTINTQQTKQALGTPLSVDLQRTYATTKN